MGQIANDISIEGKVASVTGATSGIGRMITETLLRHGAKVCFVDRRTQLCETVPAALAKRIGAIDDVGGLVVFLSGRMSTPITGAVLPLDGGWSIKGLSWHLPYNT